MDFAKHWSFKLANDDAALPTGPFLCFEQAIERLAPISSLHRESNDVRIRCVCIKCAGDHVQRLAVEYNQSILLNTNAPRAKSVLDRAKIIEGSAEKLLDALLGMDDYSRKAFYELGGYNATKDLPIYAGFFDDFPEADSASNDECLWVENLQELIAGARLVSDRYRRLRGVSPHQPADKGGNTNLYKEVFGSPDRNVVISAWDVFERFQPKRATGTEHGAFHEFLKNVVEYATGGDPEAQSTLVSWLKALANPLRKREDAIENLLRADAESKYLEADPKACAIARDRWISTRSTASNELERSNSLLEKVKLGK